MSSVGGSAAAAQDEMRRRAEEEEMTSYGPKDLADGWEFKILRSNFGAFRNPRKMRAVLDEEYERGGWVFVEKFDNYRLRLKRPAGTKLAIGELDSPYDPYRTEVGAMKAGFGLVILVVMAFFMAMVFFLVGA